MNTIVIFFIIIVMLALFMHLGIGTYLFKKLSMKNEDGEIPWLNPRNVVVMVVLVLVIIAHLIQFGVIGGGLL